MTREEAKKMLPFIQAYAKGKTIQFRAHINDEWKDIKELVLNRFTGEYRIKPKPKYRPFKSQEECWNEMLKHKPLGWLRSKRIKDIYLLITIRNHEIRIFNDLSLHFSKAYRKYEFQDGSPFGIKE